MKFRYLPIIIDKAGRIYENCSYRHLFEAVAGLEYFLTVFAESNDVGIADFYILNTITGKQIRP